VTSATTPPDRPVCHFTPPAGWMNDPNGLVHHAGEWHLHYQHHPHSLVWGPMHWGHAVSRDLLTWEHLPIALAPDEHGTIFSGSAVIDHDGVAGHGKGALVAFYTSHRERDRGQSLAVSLDAGRTWTKHPGNPVLLPPDGSADFRDPQVVRYQHPAGPSWWVMVVAAGRVLRFYRSDDLLRWTPTGTYALPAADHLGVVETPELFELPVDDTAERVWVLAVGQTAGGPQGGSGVRYLLGRFDGERFTPIDGDTEVRWADHGADFYAAQSWTGSPDGRRIWVGWMSNWAYAERIPASSWRGMLSIPRELGLTRGTDGRLRLTQWPVRELRERHVSMADLREPDLATVDATLARIRGSSLDVTLEVEFASHGRRHLELAVHRGPDGATRIGYDPASGQLVVDRSAAGGAVDEAAPAHHRSRPLTRRDVVELRVLVDTASVEVFAEGGAVVLSVLAFPRAGGSGLQFRSDGARVTRLEVAEVTATG
jgi:fructan beta-fructosidase